MRSKSSTLPVRCCTSERRAPCRVPLHVPLGAEQNGKVQMKVTWSDKAFA